MSKQTIQLSVCALAVCFGLFLVRPVTGQSKSDEPIAFTGHGAFFDASGKQITPTSEFIERAQVWYRDKLVATASGEGSNVLKNIEGGLTSGLVLDAHERLIVQQRSLVLLAESAPQAVDPRMLGKLKALDRYLRVSTPGNKSPEYKNKPYKLNIELEKRLELSPIKGIDKSSVGSGKDYENDCKSADVPFPPAIGLLDAAGSSGWQSHGFIPQDIQFIVGSPAELRSFETDKGICFALPRYSDDKKSTVDLDGVICVSKKTSKTCIWDNQMNGVGFQFPSGSLIPIGAPDLTLNPDGLYQGGGQELEFGTGGVCTQCHAGENPFVIHPKADLGAGVLMGSLSIFPSDMYQPLVGDSWPKNKASEADANVPAKCGGCHTQGGPGGRFPALATPLGAYCGTVLAQAIERTMPPSSPGSLKNDPEVVAFLGRCNSSAQVAP